MRGAGVWWVPQRRTLLAALRQLGPAEDPRRMATIDSSATGFLPAHARPPHSNPAHPQSRCHHLWWTGRAPAPGRPARQAAQSLPAQSGLQNGTVVQALECKPAAHAPGRGWQGAAYHTGGRAPGGLPHLPHCATGAPPGATLGRRSGAPSPAGSSSAAAGSACCPCTPASCG